jgi:hypothetical protein
MLLTVPVVADAEVAKALFEKAIGQNPASG